MKNDADRGGGRDNTLQYLYLPNSLHVSFKSQIQSLFQLLNIHSKYFQLNQACLPRST